MLLETISQGISPLLRLLLVVGILMHFLVLLLLHCIDLHLILDDFGPLILAGLLILVLDKLISLETVVVKVLLVKSNFLTSMVAHEVFVRCLWSLVVLVRDKVLCL